MYKLIGAALLSIILTDRCLAYMNAVARCFPAAVLLLCLWYANKAVLTHYRPSFIKKENNIETPDSINEWNNFYNYWHSIIRLDTEEIYEKRVKELR